MLTLLLAFTLPAAADKAKSLYNKGADAEVRQNWEQAYNYYKQAAELKPKDLKYRAAFYRARAEAAMQLVHRGIILRENGNLQEAVAMFQRAMQIDPSLDAAQTEFTRTQQMIEKSAPPAPTSVPPPTELGEQAIHALGPAQLKPIENTPITLRMTQDTKAVYTAIGNLAGINVLFDPDYVSRQISIDLKNVSLYEALEIVALESKTFYRAVTSNTIFVAADTKTKRQELEEQVVKTFYLSNAYSTTDVQDALNTIRTITDITRLVNLTAQNAIVVRGSPDAVALAEKLINDIDKPRPEVLVDVAILQVSRDKIRQLGINPPSTASVSLQNNVTTTTNNNTNNNNTNTNSNTNNPTSTTTNQALTLNSLANLTSNSFFVNIPSASVAFMLSDSNTKIIQNPQVRSMNGLKATLKIGDRVPVATGSFSGAGGVAGLGVSPLVNTQFQYIDVGVNLDITPVVNMDNSVSLKLDMEVSSVTTYQNIGGIQQPVIGQRHITHEIRLKAGETSIMGGMLEDTNLKSLSGWPILSQIPIIKYLFGQENVEHRTNEIVFVLTPHIVRGHDVTEQNLRPIDVGTQNAIELRRGGEPPATQPVAPPAVTPQAPAQAVPPPTVRPAPPTPGQGAVPAPQTTAPPQGAQGAPVPTTPPGQPPAANQVQPAAPAQTQAGAPAILSFEPAQITQTTGAAFGVNVSIANATNVYSVPVEISYDPKQLQLLNVSPGQFLQKDGQPVALVHRGDEQKGTLVVNATRPPGASGLSGQGTVFTLTFMAKAPGQSMLTITRAGARDPGQSTLPVNAGQAMVTVK